MLKGTKCVSKHYDNDKTLKKDKGTMSLQTIATAAISNLHRIFILKKLCKYCQNNPKRQTGQ